MCVPCFESGTTLGDLWISDVYKVLSLTAPLSSCRLLPIALTESIHLIFGLFSPAASYFPQQPSGYLINIRWIVKEWIGELWDELYLPPNTLPSVLLTKYFHTLFCSSPLHIIYLLVSFFINSVSLSSPLECKLYANKQRSKTRKQKTKKKDCLLCSVPSTENNAWHFVHFYWMKIVQWFLTTMNTPRRRELQCHRCKVARFSK